MVFITILSVCRYIHLPMFIKSEQNHIKNVITGEVIWFVPADVIFHMPGNYFLESKSYHEYTKYKNYKAKLGQSESTCQCDTELFTLI